MAESILHIKNMVCPRCIKVISEEFEKLNISVKHIELGKVTIASALDHEQILAIKQALEDNGFELINDKKSMLIDRIKTLVIQRVHHTNDIGHQGNTSDYISKELGYDYSYLSNLFSSVVGITIEKYIINQKIEKAKELLVYDELTLNEISYSLGYSSVQHLSSQFKKVTGLTPSHYKKLKENKRKPLNEV